MKRITKTGIKKMQKQGITIADIAKKAKVSSGTVSRILNHYPDVNAKMKKKVLEVVKELNYYPNVSARQLAMTRHLREQKVFTKNAFGFVVHSLDRDNYFSFIFNGAMQEAKKLRLRLITEVILGEYIENIDIPYMIKDDAIDGIIVVGAVSEKFVKDMIEMEVPLILVNYKTNEFDKYVNSLEADVYTGAYEAIKYLIESGHRKIGMISGTLNEYIGFGSGKLRGYKAALKEYGIEYNKNLVGVEEFGYEGGYRVMRQILDRGETPTALFAVSDESALGAKAFIEESGMKVPDDISIIGFNDTSLAVHVKPTLTSVKVPIEEMGMAAVRRLHEIITNRDVNMISKINLRTELIERESVKKIV